MGVATKRLLFCWGKCGKQMRTYCKMMFEISGSSGYVVLLWLFLGSVFPDILFGTVTMTNPVFRVIVLQNPGHLSLPTRL